MQQEDFIGQLYERFSQSGSDSGPSSWEAAVDLVMEIGGSALNAVTMNSRTKQLLWARSSMDRSWLDEYEARGYQKVDPFLKSFGRGESVFAIAAGSLQRDEQPDVRAYRLNHELASCGYGSFVSSAFGDLKSGSRTMVVFCSGYRLNELARGIGKERIQLASAFIAASIRDSKPDPKSAQRIALHNQTLTQRESDILHWLASGLRNDQIAFKANIAEVTVRKHLLSIRGKLNARTREQAIAIAVRDGWIAV